MAPRQIVYFDPPLGILGDQADGWVLAVGVDPLNLSAHLGKDLLLIAEPFDRATGITAGFFGPLGYQDDLEFSWVGGRTTLYVAATTGRSSANDDTPASQYVPGSLQPFNFGIRLFDGVDPLQRSSAGAGEIVLLDPDGEHNDLIGRVWDSTPILLKRGARGTPFSGWDTVGVFRSSGLIWDTDAKHLSLRDLAWQLGAPLHAEFYGGTGDADGDTKLAGTLKPWALGYCFNVEPVLINANLQIFQFSFTSSAAVSACRHGGATLTFAADYADYAALAAASVASGHYATCLAESLVRINVTLQFGIRLDVTGDADTVNGHPSPLTRASIARRIATAHGPNVIDDASEIDTTSINRMEAYHSAPVGWFFAAGQAITKAAALDRVMAGILGWWRVRPDGRLCLGWVEDPALVTSTLSIVYKTEGMGKPRMVATAPPRAGTKISWKWNYGPQPDRSQLAGSVSDDDAALYGQQSQYAAELAPAVGSTYPTAATVTIAEAGFRDQADADVESSRQQNFLGVERQRWEVEMEIDPFTDLVGAGLTVTGDDAGDFRKLGIGDSASFVCVGLNAPGAAPTLELLR